jgi:hypothetical protein
MMIFRVQIAHKPKESPMKRIVVVCAVALLIVAVALISKPVHAAEWISGGDAYAAPWVKEIEQELLKKDYWYIYANDPRIPQAVVLRKLNQAAKAQEAKESSLAQQFVHDALSVFEEGVRKHYYSQTDIEPIMTFIRQHVPINMS